MPVTPEQELVRKESFFQFLCWRTELESSGSRDVAFFSLAQVC